jgi:hypothetical protein
MNKTSAGKSIYPKGGVFPFGRDKLCSKDSFVVKTSPFG